MAVAVWRISGERARQQAPRHAINIINYYYSI
jgi:hypothetical protein